MTKSVSSFAVLLEGFFTQRLMKQREASPHTIGSYRDTFRLLLKFTQKRLGKLPSQLELTEIDAPLVSAFLQEMELTRSISARSRNLRLAAIRSFFRYAALESPAQSAQIQRILAIPSKRHDRTLVNFLSQPEVKAILSAPDLNTWSGRRDHALILVAVQTGLRLSELTGLLHTNVVLGVGAHIDVVGKGRKQRCTPLTKSTALVLKAWLLEAPIADHILFPNARGGRLSSDGVQYILNKYVKSASKACPSLAEKRVTPHTLRHTLAMELMQAGVDRAMIALWLGHESIETTQIYLHANLELKEKILAKTTMPEGKARRFIPDDQLLAFLNAL
ncbi:site-specific integrase [soil metagenome]